MAKYPQSLRALRLLGCRNDEEHTLCLARQSASMRGGTINEPLSVPYAQYAVLMTITTSEFEAALPLQLQLSLRPDCVRRRRRLDAARTARS